jgi:hypothetical protein
MTIRNMLIAYVIALGLSLTACAPTAPPLQETWAVPLDGAQHAQIDIEMGSGILVLTTGAQELMEADFSFSNPEQRPLVDHRQDGQSAYLSVQQPPRTSPLSRHRDDWILRLTNDIPITLNLHLGTGIYSLRVGGLQVSGLHIETSRAGVTSLDLTGYWEEDLDIKITGTQGSVLTITAPQGTGTRIESHSRIRKIDNRNFSQERNVFTNEAWSGSSPELSILLEGTFSNLTLTSGFPNDMPIQIALDLARTMFSQNEVFDCSSEPQDRQPQSSDTVRDLWFDYLCHRGP